jgi:LysM repeat protein
MTNSFKRAFSKIYCPLVLVQIVFCSIICCDGNRAKEDLQNAITIGRTLKNNKSSPNTPTSHYPQSNHDEESATVHTHTLKPGENVKDLAVLYDTDWQSILKANGIEDPEELKPGQKILIPAKKAQQ